MPIVIGIASYVHHYSLQFTAHNQLQLAQLANDARVAVVVSVSLQTFDTLITGWLLLVGTFCCHYRRLGPPPNHRTFRKQNQSITTFGTRQHHHQGNAASVVSVPNSSENTSEKSEPNRLAKRIQWLCCSALGQSVSGEEGWEEASSLWLPNAISAGVLGKKPCLVASGDDNQPATVVKGTCLTN